MFPTSSSESGLSALRVAPSLFRVFFFALGSSPAASISTSESTPDFLGLPRFLVGDGASTTSGDDSWASDFLEGFAVTLFGLDLRGSDLRPAALFFLLLFQKSSINSCAFLIALGQ